MTFPNRDEPSCSEAKWGFRGVRFLAEVQIDAANGRIARQLQSVCHDTAVSFASNIMMNEKLSDLVLKLQKRLQFFWNFYVGTCLAILAFLAAITDKTPNVAGIL